MERTIKINLITIDKSKDPWINTGFSEYTKRLPKDYQLNLIEIPTIKRTKSTNIDQIKIEETQKLLDAVPKNNIVIALDEHGKEWKTKELAKKISAFHQEQQDISLLIGGPDGLSSEFLQKTKIIWSLSRLTLPHKLVRIIISEQIYRIWSIINNHPYHRD